MNFLQKFHEREAVFEKGSYKDAQEKAKWKCVLSLEFMSSDESGTEEDKEVIISHPLPWLSPNVQQFKRKLDEEALKEKSPQAKRMIKDRMVGVHSSRPKPAAAKDIPSWVFKN